MLRPPRISKRDRGLRVACPPCSVSWCRAPARREGYAGGLDRFLRRERILAGAAGTVAGSAGRAQILGLVISAPGSGEDVICGGGRSSAYPAGVRLAQHHGGYHVAVLAFPAGKVWAVSTLAAQAPGLFDFVSHGAGGRRRRPGHPPRFPAPGCTAVGSAGGDMARGRTVPRERRGFRLPRRRGSPPGTRGPGAP